MRKNIYANNDLMSFFNTQNSKDNIQDKFNEEIDNFLLNKERVYCHKNSNSSNEKILNEVVDRGINLIDTAKGYYLSEERIGKLEVLQVQLDELIDTFDEETIESELISKRKDIQSLNRIKNELEKLDIKFNSQPKTIEDLFLLVKEVI